MVIKLAILIWATVILVTVAIGCPVVLSLLLATIAVAIPLMTTLLP